MQQHGVLHREALLPLQKNIDDISARAKKLQEELGVRGAWDIQMQDTFDDMLAKSKRLQRWLIGFVIFVSAILVCLVSTVVEGEL